MVWTCTDNSHLESIFWIPSSVSIHNINAFLSIEPVNSSLSVDFPRGFRKWGVHLIPPDVLIITSSLTCMDVGSYTTRFAFGDLPVRSPE